MSTTPPPSRAEARPVEVVPVEDLDRALRAARIERMRWLTTSDIMQITGFSRHKVERMAREGKIPMFKGPDGSDEWRIRPADFEAWQDKVVAEGLRRAEESRAA